MGQTHIQTWSCGFVSQADHRLDGGVICRRVILRLDSCFATSCDVSASPLCVSGGQGASLLRLFLVHPGICQRQFGRGLFQGWIRLSRRVSTRENRRLRRCGENRQEGVLTV